jgi:hypothetical protein
MRLRFHVDPALPALAWACRYTPRSGVADVHCGAEVETHGDFFVEGAWDGSFAAGPGPAHNLTGSGGRAAGSRLEFYAPFHTFQRLHLWRDAAQVWLSNSLSFCLAAAGDELDPAYRFYHRDLYSMRLGLARSRKSIPTRRSRIDLIYTGVVAIDAAGNVERRMPDSPAPFDDYASYVAFLADGVARALANATDGRRRRTLKPLISLSSGYDTTACAVLASAAGAREAISLSRARRFQHDVCDSGAEAAARLGLSLHVVDPPDLAHDNGTPEAEFIAAHPTGEDVDFLALAPHLGQRLFLTGHVGGDVWTPYHQTGPHMPRSDCGGASLEEFRLRIGFSHFPVPGLGYRALDSINRISTSAEMKPWWVPGPYNRPIPRRIIEEAGIPRGSFAREKKATSAWLRRGTSLRTGASFFAPRSEAEFRAYAAGRRPAPMRGLAYWSGYAAADLMIRIVNRINHYAQRLGGRRILRRPYRAWAFFVGRDWSVFQWAVERTMTRYRIAAGLAPETARRRNSKADANP